MNPVLSEKVKLKANWRLGRLGDTLTLRDVSAAFTAPRNVNYFIHCALTSPLSGLGHPTHI
jgi:hypothetical protein